MNFLKKHWKPITAIGITIGLIYGLKKLSDFQKKQITEKEKDKENKTGVDGNGNLELNTIQFTFTNNTSQNQIINLFKAWTLGAGIGNPNVGVSSPVSMPFFNRTLATEPKKIISISFNTNAGQSQNVITKICKDATGQLQEEFWYPRVSTMQFQSGITTVNPDNMIINGECFLKYSINPNTVVNMTVVYGR